jgi:hypothetical protein
MLAGPVRADGTNDVIQFCRVELPQGTHGSPYALFGGAPHFLANSKVYSCSATGVRSGANDGFTSGGVNLADIKDCQIDSNTFTDCQGAAYQDTGNCDGVKVTNNVIVRGSMGVAFVTNGSAVKRNIEITGNNMLIQNRYANGASYGIWVTYDSSTNVLIRDNTITFDTAGAGVPAFWGIGASTLVDATVSDNTIGFAPDTYFNNAASGSNVTLSNNRMTDGSPAAGLTP